MATILGEQLAISQLKAPAPPARRLLAYLHSGESMRHLLPKILRIWMGVWLVAYVVSWLLLWPVVYRDLERWGLVKGFFAQMIGLAAAFLIMRITILRAGHLEAFPEDDFVVLRTMAVAMRWFGEVAMIFVVGMGLKLLLQPVSPLVWAPPAEGGSEKIFMGLISGVVTSIGLVVVPPLFLLLYMLANAIDLGMAIEFNTRAERLEKGSL